MNESEWLAERFERERPRLRAVAYRMLGSVAEADDAVQDAWLRLSRSDEERIDNLSGWLTTVVARECLHQLRSRRRRREDPLAEHLRPDRDLARQRKVVNAFYAAARTADLDALIQVLAPDVVQRTEFGATRPPSIVRGAAAVAEQARAPRRGGELRSVLVNGTVGALVTRDGQP